MKNYKNSTGRMIFLLATFAVIVYHIINGRNETVQILAAMILPIWLLSVDSWRKE